MRILVLAGGRATRLGAMSAEIPKFLVPIGEGRRFADVQLNWLKKNGFKDVILSVGHLAHRIAAYCGDGRRFGIDLRYVEDGQSPLGTGGAVRRALHGLKGPTAVLYGDTVLNFDINAALARAETAHALMTVIRCPPRHMPNAHLEGDLVRYDKESPEPTWDYIDYGFLVLSQQFVEAMPASVPLDLATPLTQTAKAGMLHGFEAREPFWEINTPEALDAFCARFGRS